MQRVITVSNGKKFMVCIKLTDLFLFCIVFFVHTTIPVAKWLFVVGNTLLRPFIGGVFPQGQLDVFFPQYSKLKNKENKMKNWGNPAPLSKPYHKVYTIKLISVINPI